jgi:hypothetical protein
MLPRLLRIALVAPLLAASFSWCQTCATYNLLTTYTPWDPSGTQGHNSGNHQYGTNSASTCTYASIGQQYCASSCSAYGSAFGNDTGTVTPIIYSHTLGAVVNGGTSSANGAQIQCGATAAVTAVACVIGLSCSVSISFSGGLYGVNVSVGFPPSSIYNNVSQNYTQTCALRADPQNDGGGGGGGGCTQQQECITCCPVGQVWDPATCTCKGTSPIVIDTTGKGFSLTSAEDGVMFDFNGDGKPLKLSWTAADSGNAFLALDRNHNGRIDSAKELFGNITVQPPSPDPNGFLALAEFDKRENGGNGDGIIDWRDAVFSQLLLWIDANHDGISQPGELHSLPEMGIYSLALTYTESRRTDQFGNQFRYKAAVNPDPEDGESKDGRITYDVFLQVAKKQAENPATKNWNAISAADHRLR